MLLGNGQGGFLAARNFNVGRAPQGVVAGDFKGDGKQDLATANVDSDTVSVLLGTGTGAFKGRDAYPAADSPSAIASTDFNGDRKADLVVVASDGEFCVLLQA